MNDFIKIYSELSDMGEDQVQKLLEIQDKQDTRYSRVKTCKKLWEIQQERLIKKENALINETRMRQYYVDRLLLLQKENEILLKKIEEKN